MDEAYRYCEALVREHDRERFLATLFAPAEKRPHLFALYAFDLEIVRIPDAVREPMAGEIRFQWWREALKGEREEEAAANPVSRAYLYTIRKYSLSVERGLASIEARTFELKSEPMETMIDLRNFVTATEVHAIDLGSKILGYEHNDDITRTIYAAAAMIGFTNALRRLPSDISKGRVFLPLEILASEGVHTAELLSGQNSSALMKVLERVRRDARAEYLTLKEHSVPQQILPALLPAATVPLYLSRIERKDFDPFRSSLEISKLRAQFEIWRAARRGRI